MKTTRVDLLNYTKDSVIDLVMQQRELISQLKGKLHERNSRITALEFKLEEISPLPKRNSGSR